MNATRLTMLCEHSGCAAKLDAELLEQIVNLWQVEDNDRVILGLREKDDVGCYALGNEYLLIHSMDVITPVVDDAFAFGNIAVSHALSDIYAKGATPVSALSFLGIPPGNAIEYLEKIIAGCSAKFREANVVLLGGHTISTSELLVGFTIMGVIESGNIISLQGACASDKLVLTKPIGSGIISTAVKFSNLGMPGIHVTEEELSAAIHSMASLNSLASKIMIDYGVGACTDVSGFGLLGHLSNLVRASGVGARLHYSLVPKLPGVLRLFGQGVAPVRLDENMRNYYFDKVSLIGEVPGWPILFSPETSGGLLMAVREDLAQQFVNDIKALGVTECGIIGEVLNDSLGRMIVDY